MADVDRLAIVAAWKTRVRRRAIRKFGVGPFSVSLLVKWIRQHHEAAPRSGRYQTLGWYVGEPYPPRPAGEKRSDKFLRTEQWRRLRMRVLRARGARCECCGATAADGTTQIHVDHIKPRRTHPELALEISNLQVLCGACNHGKGNWDRTDWRLETRQVAARPVLVKAAAAVDGG